MNNKEAIERLKWVQKRICDITYSPESFEAINLAIKALEERPKGKWEIIYGEHIRAGLRPIMYACGVCGMVGSRTNFCPNCGADMRGDA